MKVSLAELAELRAGYQFRSGVKDDARGDTLAGVIQLRNVEAGKVQWEQVERVRLRKVEPYRLKTGDVLFSNRGQQMRSCAIQLPEVRSEEPVLPFVAMHLFSLVRLKDPQQVLPSYLVWHLNHPQTQEELRPLIRSVAIPFVSLQDIAELMIAVPPLETQRTIVALDTLQKREAAYMNQLAIKRNLLITHLTHQIATGQIVTTTDSDN